MNTLTDPIYTEDIKGLSWKARIFTTQASRVLTPGHIEATNYKI